MLRRINRKLAQRTALQVSALLLFIALCLGTFSLASTAKALRQQLQQTPELLLQSNIPAFTLATFNYNDRLNQQLSDGLINHPSVLRVSVIDSTGGELAHAHRSQRCQVSAIEYAIFDVQDIHIANLFYRATAVGKVILRSDPCSYIEQFRQAIIHAAAYTLLLCLLVTGFIYFSHHRLISRPLRRLTHKAKAIDDHHIDQQILQQFQSQREDELGQLSRAFYHLLETLTRHIQRQQQAEAQVAEYSAKLEQLVNRRSQALQEASQQQAFNKQHLYGAVQSARQQFINATWQQLASDQQPDVPTARALLQHVRWLEKSLTLSSDADQEIVLHSWIEHSLTHQGLYPLTITQLQASDQVLLIAEPLHTSVLVGVVRCLQASGAPALTLQAGTEAIESRCQLAFELRSEPFEQQQQVTVALEQDVIVTEQGLMPGLSVYRQLLEAHGGSLQLECDQSLRLMWRLPCHQQHQVLQQVQSGCHQPIGLMIADSGQRNKVKTLLQQWQLPYNRSHEPDPSRLIISDDLSHAAQARTVVIGQELAELGHQWTSAQLLLALAKRCSQPAQVRRQTTALVAEDNTISRMLCQRFLKNLGVTAELADNGLHALEMARERSFDVILMDCQMPIMDGFEATRQIRRASLNQDTPIIALTGLSGEGERQDCLNAGMNDFIGKPFTQVQVHSALLQWLDGA